MAVVKKNLAGYTWGLVPESFGISAKSFKSKFDSELYKHKNEQGETIGKVFWDFKMSGTVSGATNAVPALAIGDSITLANEITGFGVVGGTTIAHSFEVSRENEALMDLVIEFERIPTLTVV
jgi:hypothetical protein